MRQEAWGPHGARHLHGALPFGQEAHSALLCPFQVSADPELSLYDSEEDGPSYWDLEQVSLGAERGEGQGDPLRSKVSPPIQSSHLESSDISFSSFF